MGDNIVADNFRHSSDSGRFDTIIVRFRLVWLHFYFVFSKFTSCSKFTDAPHNTKTTKYVQPGRCNKIDVMDCVDSIIGLSLL